MNFVYIVLGLIFLLLQNVYGTIFAVNHHICDITDDGYEQATIMLKELTSYQVTIILSDHENTQYEALLMSDTFEKVSNELCLYAYIVSLIAPDLSVKSFSELMSIGLGTFVEFNKSEYIEYDDKLKSIVNFDKSENDVYNVKPFLENSYKIGDDMDEDIIEI